MKKQLFFLLSVLFISMGIFAQTDTAQVTTVTTVGTATIYDILWNWVSSHAWYTMVITGAVILEQIIPSIKWIPGNSIVAAIWGVFKEAVNFIAGKKTV